MASTDGTFAEFVLTHADATRFDTLDFIERTWGVRVSTAVKSPRKKKRRAPGASGRAYHRANDPAGVARSFEKKGAECGWRFGLVSIFRTGVIGSRHRAERPDPPACVRGVTAGFSLAANAPRKHGTPRREDAATGWGGRCLALLLLAGYLLFCHGCHGDEDNELFTSATLPAGAGRALAGTSQAGTTP